MTEGSVNEENRDETQRDADEHGRTSDMSKHARVLSRVLSGTADASIRFDELRGLLLHLGFDERVRGSHHRFTREDIEDILDLHARGHEAKPYQVKQVRRIMFRYKRGGRHGG